MEYIYYLESIIYYVKQQCLMVNNKSHIVNIHRNSNKEFKTHKKNKIKLWNVFWNCEIFLYPLNSGIIFIWWYAKQYNVWYLNEFLSKNQILTFHLTK